MEKSGRYDVSGLIEAQYEPGSDDSVLRNLLGIVDSEEMDRVEARALARATDILVREYDREHEFNTEDICHFHKTWLGSVYEWAGRYRRVNITKDNFTFAVVDRIPDLMMQLEQNQLRKYTPCVFEARDDIVRALSETHTEMLLVHPFRDGNGRIARLLSTLMALQAGLPLLDFSLIRGLEKRKYILAVQAVLSRDYQIMDAIFSGVIEKSISGSAE